MILVFRFETMELNINNYEEYFLLYADNELSVEEMRRVEDFVRNNPVLKEEFESILKTILTSDTTIEFEDKTILFKRVSSFDARTNEENLVLYHDNELSKVEEEMVERLVREDGSLKKEFDLIKRARIEADETIIFPGKQSLYKKEKDDRVIPIWWRWAAAALLIGFGIWGGVSYFGKPAPHELVKKTTSPAPSNNLPTPINKEPIVKNEKPVPVNNAPVNNNTVNDSQNNIPVVRVKHPDIPKLVPVNNINDIKKRQDENLAIDLKNKENDLANSLKDLQKTVNDAVKNLDNFKNTKTGENPSDQEYKVTQASYSDNNNVKNDEDYAFYNVSQRQFDKTKVGTLIKKTKRIVIRNLFRKNDKEPNE